MKTSRKIASWEEYRPEPTWFATLECGHRTPQAYEDGMGMSEADKTTYEALGELDCYECGRLEADIARKKAELAAKEAELAGLTARRKPWRSAP